jgi:hypothetical protein
LLGAWVGRGIAVDLGVGAGVGLGVGVGARVGLGVGGAVGDPATIATLMESVSIPDLQFA